MNYKGKKAVGVGGKPIFKTVALTLLLVLLSTFTAQGKDLGPGYEGGIGQGVDYQEILYITGKPIILTGTLDIRPGRPRDNQIADRYTYRLENQGEGVRLTRTMTITTTWREEGSQLIEETEVTRFRETVTVNGDRYQVSDDGYQFSLSQVTDRHPAVEFFSGNFSGRKVYDVNRGEGQVVVNKTGEAIGYTSPWGQAETRTMDITIAGAQVPGELQGEGNSPEPWFGTVKEELVITRGQEMNYVANGPTSSFSGGYLLTRSGEDILSYRYDLPKWDDGGELAGRNRGEDTLFTLLSPRQERLPVPAFRDIRGHWAQEKIERMASLGVFEPDGVFFAPGLAMTRGEFSRALVAVADMDVDPEGEVLFHDVPLSHPYYAQINELARRQIVHGTQYNRFQPGGSVTRVQAAVMALRLLGLENLAPVAPFSLPYLDGGMVPDWGRDALYVAGEIGLLEPDSYGRIRPQSVLTRAEAAVFLDSLVSFLRDDLSREYREWLLYYR